MTISKNYGTALNTIFNLSAAITRKIGMNISCCLQLILFILTETAKVDHLRFLEIIIGFTIKVT